MLYLESRVLGCWQLTLKGLVKAGVLSWTREGRELEIES
jgi:hypothetical protein